jgi:hypothetical protein
MLAHLRMEAYTEYSRSLYPGSLMNGAARLTIEGNEQAIAAGKLRLRADS